MVRGAQRTRANLGASEKGDTGFLQHAGLEHGWGVYGEAESDLRQRATADTTSVVE